MSSIDYEEIIALSEDPNAVFEDVGRPPTPEEHALVDRITERAFLECDPDVQASLISQEQSLTAAQELMNLLPDHARAEVLDRLPLDTATPVADGPLVSS